MKSMKTVISRKFFLATFIACSLVRLAVAGEPTALELIKLGNDYVGKDARDKVVQIRSEKSIGSLTPTIWFVVYYDADASFKSTEVKFGAGKKLDVKRPWRMLEYVKAEKVFDKAKLKVDSDVAINTATAEPLLKNLNLKATQLWLDSDLKLDLSVDAPVWKVRLWAAKLKHPNDNTDIGDVYISALDGKVVKSDLHIDRVD
jgi:hypothetical protein